MGMDPSRNYLWILGLFLTVSGSVLKPELTVGNIDRQGPDHVALAPQDISNEKPIHSDTGSSHNTHTQNASTPETLAHNALPDTPTHNALPDTLTHNASPDIDIGSFNEPDLVRAPVETFETNHLGNIQTADTHIDKLEDKLHVTDTEVTKGGGKSKTAEEYTCHMRQYMSHNECGRHKKCPSTCHTGTDCTFPYCNSDGKCKCKQAFCDNDDMCAFFRIQCRGTFTCQQGKCICMGSRP